MKPVTRPIDHLVYCVPDLEEAIQDLEHKLGIRASIGGKHITKGTKNALINLGHQCYFEILAIDKDNHTVTSNRWMGIDYIKKPKITRWSIKTTNLAQDAEIIKAYFPDLAQIHQGSRVTPSGAELNWKMTIPLAHPEVEPIPFLLDWSESQVHPTDGLREECQLEELILNLPDNSSKVKACMSLLEAPVKFQTATRPRITATITSPNGLVEL